MRKVHGIIAVLAVGALLGTTVFREAVVRAAQTIEATITNVDGNGNIKVHEQGTATVTGNVHVSNAVGSPVPVRETDEPFQAALCDAVGGLIGCGHPTDLSVPTGKRLVIEYVSGDCAISAGTILNVGVQTSAGDVAGFHILNLPPVSSSQGAANFGHVTRIYADPESTVTFDVTAPGGSNTDAACNLFISGSLVDAS